MLPVKATITHFTRNGDFAIKFNQKIHVPDMGSAVILNMLSIWLSVNSDLDPEAMTYEVELLEWTEE